MNSCKHCDCVNQVLLEMANNVALCGTEGRTIALITDLFRSFFTSPEAWMDGKFPSYSDWAVDRGPPKKKVGRPRKEGATA